jgi:hypothetical protein
MGIALESRRLDQVRTCLDRAPALQVSISLPVSLHAARMHLATVKYRVLFLDEFSVSSIAYD